MFTLSSIWFYVKYNSSYFKYNKNNFELFHSRLDRKKLKTSWFIKNYHFIYLIKKLFLTFCIFSLSDSPFIICCIGIITNFGTAILTIFYRPYKYLALSLIKATGDAILSVIWLFMILFFKFFSAKADTIVFSDEQINNI